MIMFPKSRVDAFTHQNKHLRWGQAFHHFMRLDKVDHPQDREFCDRLYNADDAKAQAMVQSRLDREN